MMLLGLDLGTSSLKGCVVRDNGSVVAQASSTYTIDAPVSDWAEQDPEKWFAAAVDVCRQLTMVPEVDVSSVSLSGQLHGVVCLNKEGKCLRPAIIWADRRSAGVLSEIDELYGWDRFCATTKNRPATGFGVITLRWLVRNEPHVLEQTATVLSAKDYLRYRLCGEIGTDFSDASGLACLDMTSRSWSRDLLNSLSIPSNVLPQISMSHEQAGVVSKTASEKTRLKAGTPVFIGGADACMAGIGNGIVTGGVVSSNIGTAGQVAAVSSELVYDSEYRTNTFCHVLEERWIVFGATLSAGLCMQWLSSVLNTPVAQLIAESQGVPPGSDGLIFLPYLNGERTPHFDSDAAGVFWGLTPRHTAPHLARAVMEGVCFSLNDCMQLILDMGITPKRVVAAGGGSRNESWVQMQADVFGIPVGMNSVQADACIGAAIVAGYGCGSFSSIEEGCQAVLGAEGEVLDPVLPVHRRYLEISEIYSDIYRANQPVFPSRARW